MRAEEPTSLVVHLSSEGQERLTALMSAERLSASEVVVRALDRYVDDEVSREEEAELKMLLAEMNEALDKALLSAQASEEAIDRNLAAIYRSRSSSELEAAAA